MSRRDSKPRDKRRAERKARQQGPVETPANPFAAMVGDGSFNRMVRQTCSKCGAPVEWVDEERAKAHGMDVSEAVEFLGVEDAAGLDIWICTRCDEGGVMGPAESSF